MKTKKLLENYLALVKNYLPEKKANKPSIGLDIGTHSCKLIEVIPAEHGFQILNWAVEPIGHSGPDEVIKKILNKLDIQAKNISTAVAGQGTLIRYIEMPRMPLKDAKKSFALEADKYFPFPKDQIYTDCYIVDPERLDNRMLLLVAAAKKEIIDQRIKLLSDLGLQPDFVGINAIALANVFHMLAEKVPEASDSATPDATAIVDIGESVSSLVILKGNTPYFTRDILIGGKEINKRISNVLGIGIEEAEKVKYQPGDNLQNIMGACETILTNLASEVRLSFDYFLTEHNMQISKVYLTGGSSLLGGAKDFFSKNLDTPTEQWNPVSLCQLLPGVLEEEIKKNSNYLGVALGLALY